jgi:predicted polyphosphate/ATP-dependent NAD kinase
MRPGVRYLLGPGTTTAAVGRALNLPTTLLGIDLIADHRLLGSALTERQLLSHLSRTDRPIHAVLSVIGGQGFVLGRGNQQLSPAVLANVSELLILATTQKLAALQGRPLLADTGDPDTDDRLAGYVHVLTGHRESTRYRLAATNPALPSPEGVHP